MSLSDKTYSLAIDQPDWYAYLEANPVSASLGEYTTASASSTNVVPFGFKVASDIKGGNALMTAGKYRLYISNPTGISIASFKQITDYVLIDGTTKKYTIDNVAYDVKTGLCMVDINIMENPIPLFVIWGAVALAVMIVGAISANSVLEKVETIVAPITKSPVVYLIMIAILAPFILTMLGKRK